MSGKAMKWAMEKVTIDHPGLSHLVLILAIAADKNGATFKSQATIAGEMGGSQHTVRKWLSALDQLKVIQRIRRSNGRGGRSSDIIRLRMDRDRIVISKADIVPIFQAAHGAGCRERSNRHGIEFQPAPGANDQVSDQLKVVITHKEQPQDYQSAQRAADRKPTLAVVNGGRV